CISISTRNNITDQEALLALKAAITYDPENLLKNNWTTNTSFCNWVGIICSNRRQRVRELNISGMGLLSANLLSGQIPSGIWKCTKLQSISLSTNYFVGEIPEEVGYLPILRILLLGGNNLTGLYGYTVFGLMKHLSASCYSSCFHNFSHFYILVTGHILRSIFNMTSIQNIDFSFNNLSGTIPSNVENVPNLQHLMLQYNTLTGHIPASVFNISTLLRLSLDSLDKIAPRQLLLQWHPSKIHRKSHKKSRGADYG
ncbi:hypothetical protein Tsubulata_022071, partial [Turnera subulata]